MLTISNDTISLNPPTISLLYPPSPAPGSRVSGTVNLRFSADRGSDSAIAAYISIDGGDTLPTATDSTAVLYTDSLADGSHTVLLVGRTEAREITFGPVVYIVDNAPLVSITSPAGGSIVSGTIALLYAHVLKGDATAASDSLFVDGRFWKTLDLGGADSLQTTAIPDGEHSIAIKLTDSRGRQALSPALTLLVRNSLHVDIIAPQPGEYVRAVDTLVFVATPVEGDSISRLEMAVDGSEWYDLSTAVQQNASLFISVTRAAAANGGDSVVVLYSTTGFALGDGTHTVDIRATDDKNRHVVAQRDYLVDNTAPILSNAHAVYSEPGAHTRSGSLVLITAFCEDVGAGLGAGSVVLHSNELDTTIIMNDSRQNGDVVEGDHMFSALVQVVTTTSDTVAYTISATDRIGNTKELTASILIDNSPPEIIEFEMSPQPQITAAGEGGRTYHSRIIISGAYTDSGGSGILRAHISVANDSGTHVNTSPVELSAHDSVFSRIVELAPGENYVSFVAVDRAGNNTTRVDTIVYIVPKATALVSQEGGTVTSPDGASVSVPKNALRRNVEITITKVNPVDQPKPLDTCLTLLNVAHDFGPDGQIFRFPVTLTLPYTEADLDKDQDGARDVDPSKLTVVFWDGGTWMKAGEATVNLQAQTVSVTVNHFAMFDLAQDNCAKANKLVSYWTANPVRASRGAHFTFNLPEDGDVSLLILDLAGDLVNSIVRDQTMTAGKHSFAWAGHNTAEKFAGVGTYVYVFVYKNSATGNKTVIRKPVGLLR
jgi:hypothetical protein